MVLRQKLRPQFMFHKLCNVIISPNTTRSSLADFAFVIDFKLRKSRLLNSSADSEILDGLALIKYDCSCIMWDG